MCYSLKDDVNYIRIKNYIVVNKESVYKVFNNIQNPNDIAKAIAYQRPVFSYVYVSDINNIDDFATKMYEELGLERSLTMLSNLNLQKEDLDSYKALFNLVEIADRNNGK